MTDTFLAMLKIQVGKEITTKVAGLTIDPTIVISTLVAMIIVLGMGFWLRAKVTSGVPGKLQLFWETVVDQVSQLVENSIGPSGAAVVPLAVSLFFFILIANELEMIPSGVEKVALPPPTGNVNLPYAMAFVVIIGVHAAMVKRRGVRGYFRRYASPMKALAPINVVEEIVKPFTLSLRLFGNVFAGGLMLALISGLFPVYVVPFGDALWKLFDFFIFVLQAFIFSLLTIVYFGMAMDTSGAH
jgi:F-type H+-transporting ATPase subunit a